MPNSATCALLPVKGVMPALPTTLPSTLTTRERIPASWLSLNQRRSASMSVSSLSISRYLSSRITLLSASITSGRSPSSSQLNDAVCPFLKVTVLYSKGFHGSIYCKDSLIKHCVPTSLATLVQALLPPRSQPGLPLQPRRGPAPAWVWLFFRFCSFLRKKTASLCAGLKSLRRLSAPGQTPT